MNRIAHLVLTKYCQAASATQIFIKIGHQFCVQYNFRGSSLMLSMLILVISVILPVFVYFQLTEFSLLFFFQFTCCTFHNIQDAFRNSKSAFSDILCHLFCNWFQWKHFYFEEVNIGLRMSDYLAQINREKRLSFQAESANFMRTGDVCLELISHFKLLEVVLWWGHLQQTVKMISEDE